MKRIIALILILSMCLTFMTSCTVLAGTLLIWAATQEPNEFVDNVFFDKEYLNVCLLSDMPVPSVENSKRTDTELYLNMTDEEFDTYSKAIFDYLLTKKDAYFKGYLAESGLTGGILWAPEDRYAVLTEEYDIEKDFHEFIFSTTELLNEGDGNSNYYWNEVVISIARSFGTLEKSDFTYNTVITIKNKDNNTRGSVYIFA